MKKILGLFFIFISLISCQCEIKTSEQEEQNIQEVRRTLNSGELTFEEALEYLSKYRKFAYEGKFTDSEGHLHKIFGKYVGRREGIISTEDDPKCPVCYGIFD